MTRQIKTAALIACAFAAGLCVAANAPGPQPGAIGDADRPGIRGVHIDAQGRWSARLPDGTRVSWLDDESGHRWVRYDGPGDRTETGRVDAGGQRFGAWFARGNHAETTLWAFGVERTGPEMDRIMAEDPPRLAPAEKK